ncbi:MAG: hypothetical protein LBH79_07585 [Nitrososphaerota archaeon]|nr:hypothetical protein [Nitrososphaerota archaeon]
MSKAENKPSKQKVYNMPKEIVELLQHLLETNREELRSVGITTDAKLLEVLARNGAPTVVEMMAQLREARKARTPLS